MTSSAVRRLLRLSTVALAGTLVVLAAGPAAAAPPETWPEADPVGILGAVLLLGGVPLLVFVVTALLVYAPSVARGEPLAPGSQPEGQWLGGPRRSPQELAAPDDGDSKAGGAGGSW